MYLETKKYTPCGSTAVGLYLLLLTFGGGLYSTICAVPSLWTVPLSAVVPSLVLGETKRRCALTGTLPAAILLYGALYILRVLPPPLVCAQTPGHVRATAPMPDLPCVYTHAVFLDVFGPWPHRLSCNGQG